MWRYVLPFWVKTGKCLKAARMFGFEVRRNKKAKLRKIERSTKRQSRIFDIFDFNPQNLTSHFFKKIFTY